MSIRVLCIDDHPIVREGLRALLAGEPDFEVVALAENGKQGIRLFDQYRPDITLVDLRLPDMRGVVVVTEIRRLCPTARIAILTTYASEEEIFLALQAGAVSYVLKDTLADDLVRVIREVHAGGRPLSGEVAALLASRIGQPALTPRESEVLGLVAKGLRNKEIAASLAISDETAQVHVRRIISKLGVHDRTEAVTVGLKRGIIQLE